MRKLNLKNKKIKPLFFIMLIALVIVVGGTIAYFLSSTSFENKFRTSYYDVAIEEEFYNNWGTKKVSIVNNDSTSVALRISYTEIWTNYFCKAYEEGSLKQENQSPDSSDNQNGRLGVSEDLSGSGNIVSGTSPNCIEYGEEYLNNKIDGQDVVIKEWTEEWLNDFVLGNDGWYYYKKVLNSNSNVQILNSIMKNPKLFGDDSSDRDDNMGTLSRLQIQHNLHQRYTASDYELDFNYEAVQADKKAIKELWGHDVTITDNEIEWSFN